MNSGKAAARKRPDGRPVGKPFQPGVSGNPEGRPKGALNLSTHIRNILEGDVAELPKAIADTIIGAVGEARAPLDAMVIVALLQALQGEKPWADWLSQYGYGKPAETHRLEGGDPANPIVLKQDLAAASDVLVAAIAKAIRESA